MIKPQRRNKAQPLADLVDACIAPALSAQGFASSDILLAWPDIVGEKLALFTQPLELQWPRRRTSFDDGARPDPATLIVRVESAFALELQHSTPLVIEKVNTYFGWKCVGKIVLKQGPVRRESPPPAPVPLTAGEKRFVEDTVAPLEDVALREALRSLGEQVISAEKRRRAPKL